MITKEEIGRAIEKARRAFGRKRLVDATRMSELTSALVALTDEWNSQHGCILSSGEDKYRDQLQKTKLAILEEMERAAKAT